MDLFDVLDRRHLEFSNELLDQLIDYYFLYNLLTIQLHWLD